MIGQLEKGRATRKKKKRTGETETEKWTPETNMQEKGGSKHDSSIYFVLRICLNLHVISARKARGGNDDITGRTNSRDKPMKEEQANKTNALVRTVLRQLTSMFGIWLFGGLKIDSCWSAKGDCTMTCPSTARGTACTNSRRYASTEKSKRAESALMVTGEGVRKA